MSHIPYTTCRHGTYYNNRRAPKHTVDLYDSFIRYGLSSDPVVATTYAKRLSEVLETLWQSKHSVSFINIPAVLDSFIPRFFSLSEIAAEYRGGRGISDHLLRWID